MRIGPVLAWAKAVLLLGTFAFTIQPGQSSIRVRNTAQAVGSILTYLRKQNTQNAPVDGVEWQEKTLYAPGNPDFAVTSRLLTSDDWLIEVSQEVAPISRTVYQVTVFSSRFQRYWKGSVRADGSVSEETAFKQLSEEESQRVDEEFMRKTQVAPPMPGGYGH